MTANNRISNRLAREKSPYLLQHANNPVDWYPWGDEAFAKSKAENKPIFLSIGYSTCHWCHVMERESFEDGEVAEILNKYFISIKVDREERPDIDHVYMNVCQKLTGSGGWPLTIVMTPDKEPFFAGTYFPKDSKYGYIGLIQLLEKINQLWINDKNSVLDSAKDITQSISKPEINEASCVLTEESLDRAFENLKNIFDDKYGGFRDAPKFPSPHTIMFLLRYYKMKKEQKALEMALKTLDSMYRGGIYDHIGFGFSRYSTDKKWLVPHFEKMLYDNALMIYLYTEAYQVTKDDLYKKIALEICHYILRDMTSDLGGFYSAEDADSEGEEGKFYVWDKSEIYDVLGEKDGEYFCQIYGISEKGNFEGKNIPNLIENEEFKNIEKDTKVKHLKEMLYKYREGRVKPFKDDKILTSWNGLLIAAMAYAGRVFDDEKILKASTSAANFIINNMRCEDGRLLARYRNGDAEYLAYLEDYSYFIWGLLELYMGVFENNYLNIAVDLAEDMINLFYDTKEGGFFHYGIDGEKLIARPKEIYDGALPSGNSVAAMIFLKLSLFTGKKEYEEIAAKMFEHFGAQVEEYPAGFTYFISSFLFNIAGNMKIVLAGDKEDVNTMNMIKIINSEFLPDAVIILKEKNDEEYKTIDGKATAYVCNNRTCSIPATDSNELKELLL